MCSSDLAGADALELPQGGDQTLSGDTITAPSRAGAYFYLRNGTRVGALVVNAEPAESELARLTPAALAAQLGIRPANVFTDSSAFTASVLAAAPERPLVAPLLFVAAAALLIETLVTSAGRRKVA